MNPKGQMLELRNGVSEDVKDLMFVVQDEHESLSRMREFLSNRRCDMPSVEPFVRREVFNIDPLLIGVWELQLDGTHRWHILKHWSLGRCDKPGHVLLLRDPEGEFIPLDGRVIDMLKQIYLWTASPRRTIEEMLLQNELKRQKMQDKIHDDTRQGWKYLRRLFARNAWGTVGNCWERGIELPYANRTKSARIA